MKNLKYTCLFGGGAIRGVSYIGAIKALEELNINLDILGGSSVGSIFAALLAVGYNSNELYKIFTKVNFNLFRDISFGMGPLFAISKGEVFLDWIRDLIEQKFYGDKYKKGKSKPVKFKDLNKELIIITTDLGNFECKEFSKIETPEYEIASAIRISCCMPGLMKPVDYDNRLLVDGDLQKSWPMWKLSKNLQKNDNRILEFRLEGYYETNDISGIDYANAVYSCVTAYSTKFVTDIYGQKDKYDFIVLNTGDIVVVDFNINEEKRNKLIESGYKQTISYFKNDLYNKKINLEKYYKILKDHLIKIDNYINSYKILKAKIQFGDLYMDLCNYFKYFDKKDYEILNSIRDLFLQNIKYPSLFGRIKLQNDKLIKAEIQNFINKINTKTLEYEEYIK